MPMLTFLRAFWWFQATSAWKAGLWTGPRQSRICLGINLPLSCDTSSLFQQRDKALGHSFNSAQCMRLIKCTAAWHSPPVPLPQSSLTRRKSLVGIWKAGNEKSFQGALLVLLTPRDLSQGTQRINYSMRYTTTTSLETMGHFWIVPRHL